MVALHSFQSAALAFGGAGVILFSGLSATISEVMGLQSKDTDVNTVITALDAPLRDAWIYPDEPKAKAALQQAGMINAVRAEFFRVQEDGALELLNQSEEFSNGYSEDNVAFFKKYSREQYITVAGQMQGTEKAMKNARTITTLVNMAQKTGFGIELDWEEYGQWTPTYYTAYKKFVSQLANELHARGLRLHIDGPPIPDANSQNWYVWRYEELAPLVDATVMMIYDNQYDMGVGSAIAPKEWSLQCLRWLKATAGERAIAGIAAYGYSGRSGSYEVKINTSDVINRKVTSVLGRNDGGEIESRQGSTYYAYADSKTLDMRLEQVRASGINRLSVWSLGSNPWFSR